MHGIYIRIVHTGVVNTSLLLSDVYPTTDGHTAFRRAGPVYVPVGGSIDLVYTGEVATSFETGTIRGFIDQGYVTAEIESALVPPGTVTMYAGASAPVGYLLCDGSAVSRTTYALLFAAVGTAFGVGDGATTFNVPDMRGRGPLGVGAGAGLTPRALADVDGYETVTLTSAEMPSHSHTHNANGGTGSLADPSTGLAYSNSQNTAAGGLDVTVGELNLYTNPIALSINTTGGGGAHENMSPFVAVNFIIKA